MQKANQTKTMCFLLMVLSACAETEFFDDFKDGNVRPAYQFVVGNA